MVVEAVLKLRPAIDGDGFASGRGDGVDEFGGGCGGGAGHLSDFSKGAEKGMARRCGAEIAGALRCGHSGGARKEKGIVAGSIPHR